MNTQIINGREYITCPIHNNTHPAERECTQCYMERQKRNAKYEREQRAKELHYSAKVGDFLYEEWGYEQTNVTFWQVTRKTAKCLYGRSVNQRRVENLLPNGQGAMAGKVYPIKDDFRTPTAVKLNLNKCDLYDGVNGVSASWYG